MITIDIEQDAHTKVGYDEQGGVWASSDTFEKEDNSIVAEYQRQQWAISEGLTQIEQITALEDIFDAAGDDISEQAEKMLQVTLEHITNRLGIERPTRPALESYKTKSAALETIGAFLKDMWDRIVAMFKKLGESIKKMLGLEASKKLSSQAERVKGEGKEIAKSAATQPRNSEISDSSVQKFKHLGDNFDIKAVSRDLSVLHETVKTFVGFEKAIGDTLRALNKLVEERIESESDFDMAAVDAVFAALNTFTGAHFHTLTDRNHYSDELDGMVQHTFRDGNVKVHRYLALKGLSMGRVFAAVEHAHPKAPMKHLYAVISPNYSEHLSETYSAMVPDMAALQSYAATIDKVHQDFASGTHAADESEYDKQVKIMERIRDLSGKKKSPWFSAAPAMYHTLGSLEAAGMAMLNAMGASVHDHWNLYESFIKQYKVEKTS